MIQSGILGRELAQRAQDAKARRVIATKSFRASSPASLHPCMVTKSGMGGGRNSARRRRILCPGGSSRLLLSETQDELGSRAADEIRRRIVPGVKEAQEAIHALSQWGELRRYIQTPTPCPDAAIGSHAHTGASISRHGNPILTVSDRRRLCCIAPESRACVSLPIRTVAKSPKPAITLQTQDAIPKRRVAQTGGIAELHQFFDRSGLRNLDSRLLPGTYCKWPRTTPNPIGAIPLARNECPARRVNRRPICARTQSGRGPGYLLWIIQGTPRPECTAIL